MGRDALVLALFQQSAYFEPMARRYERLAAGGATVVVAHIGDAPPVPGLHFVTLDPADPLASEWALVLLSPTVGAHVTGTDLHHFDPAETDLESGRQFEATWGFDRFASADLAERLVGQLRDHLPDQVVAHATKCATAARSAPPSVTEFALEELSTGLVERIEVAERHLQAAIARADARTDRSTTDTLTGLANRDGVQRWLGGDATDGLATPCIGVVRVDLDDVDRLCREHSPTAVDELLRLVGRALVDVTRPGDVVSRWGFSQFLVLCPGLDDVALQRMGDRLVASVHDVAHAGISPTASAGVQSSERRPLELDDVDAAVLAARHAGGNRAVAAGPAVA
jgi:GGDEF domain-containing protein